MASANFKIIPKRVGAESTATYPLSPEQLQFYRDNGYLVIKGLIGIPALNSYRQRFTDVCEGRVKNERVTVVKDQLLAKTRAKAEHFIYKIQDILYDDVYSTYSEDPRLLHIVTQLIGEDITAVSSMLINKPPGSLVHPPHQDLIYFPFRPADGILAAWTAIDPANRDTGCLYMVPGSQKADVLYEHREQVNGVPLFYSIANPGDVAPERARVYLEMDPGDTVFFHSNIVHGSNPNVTQQYRKAMTCHYAHSSCHYIEAYGKRPDEHEIASQMEAELRRMGSDLSYTDMWRVKTKQVRGVRSNL